MKYFVVTFGCQMNRSDSERITSVLEGKKYKPALKIENANLIVVNMCSVRQSAVDRVYGILEKVKKTKAQTILTGCILKKDKKKFEKLFDQVLSIKEILKWYRCTDNGTTKKRDSVSNSFSALVPIMTGCDNFCSYCVVPYTRHREISRPVKEIICEVRNLVKKGYKEIWLLGQNVNSYSDMPFSELLRKINNISGKFWIRFTSSHPKDFSSDIIKAMKECKKVTPYLNLPVQAGDDKILKKMNRPYTIKQYKKIIKEARKHIPNITISTDVIVGFPGETKQQFNNTVKLFKEIKYDMAYINKYSFRAGTKAAKLKDGISALEKKEREGILNNILKQTALENNKKYINKEVEALIDSQKSKDAWIGKTKEYKTIVVESKNNLLGQFIKAKITNATSWGLKGEYVK